jgi:molecular chaperone GrpE (heat shock protein)
MSDKEDNTRGGEEKVIVPSEEEVAKYGGRPEEAAGGASPSAAPPGESEWKETALRARAELSNYQKRSEKDRAEALRYACGTLVKALLPVLDNLERVVQTGSETGVGQQALLDGVKLTLEQFHKVLRDFNVEPIPAEGQPFGGSGGKLMEQGARHHLCEARFGPFRQKVPDPLGD